MQKLFFRTTLFIFLIILLVSLVSASAVTRYVAGVAKVTDNNVEFIVADRLGSERIILNESGDVNAEYLSLPYGQTIIDNGSKYGFTGKEKDVSTNLHYFGARYYDSDVGRFTGVDPVASNHAYVYVSNKPMNYVDPTGMDEITKFKRPANVDWTNSKHNINLNKKFAYHVETLADGRLYSSAVAFKKPVDSKFTLNSLSKEYYDFLDSAIKSNGLDDYNLFIYSFNMLELGPVYSKDGLSTSIREIDSWGSILDKSQGTYFTISGVFACLIDDNKKYSRSVPHPSGMIINFDVDNIYDFTAFTSPTSNINALSAGLIKYQIDLAMDELNKIKPLQSNDLTFDIAHALQIANGYGDVGDGYNVKRGKYPVMGYDYLNLMDILDSSGLLEGKDSKIYDKIQSLRQERAECY